MYKMIKGYQKNDELRQSFNKLAMEIFNLGFEDWYQNGFWGENYIPYSIVLEGKVIANVSVSITDMVFKGKKMHFIQLGTVMTKKKYRNKGLIREIINQIEEDYKGKVDGIYLFANDTVLDFYPKFGFEKAQEYQYSMDVENNGDCQLEQILMSNNDDWARILNTIEKNVFRGKFDMIDNNELIMFYVTKFMQECVYYHQETDTFIIAEIKNENMYVHNIFSSTLNNLDMIIPLFGRNIKGVTFGFTPVGSEKYNVKELIEKDTTFFMKGDFADVICKEKMKIPSLAHA